MIFSLIVAVLGSWTALDLQQHARSHARRSRHYWFALTAVAMGTSIFAMHFIAMLGFNLGTPIRYDPRLTIISLLLAIGGTGVAFFTIRQKSPSRASVAVAGVAMGSAICLMHYVGMAAMHVSATVRYQGVIVLASWIVAVIVASSALYATLKERSLQLRIVGSVVLGVAIFSMHFTAMAAASFEPLPSPLRVDGHLDQFSVALWVGTSTLLLLFLALISAMFARQIQAVRAERLEKRLHHVSHLNAMGMMASTLAHELNQPLTSAANYLVGVRRLLSRPTDEDEKLQVDFGLAEAEQQIRRAGDIITRVRGMVSDGTLHRKPSSLITLVEHSLQLCRSSGECADVSVRLDLDSDNDLLLVDPVQTEQVLANLIRNACQAMAGLADKQLTISSRRTGEDFVEIQVSDLGPGFQLDEGGDMFAAFPESTGKGLGLGLAISRTIVEAHEGRMRATNNESRGASFCFTMPIAPVS